MPSGETRAQLAALKLDPARPLVISDVDEVIVHFTRAFEAFLESLGMWLDAASLALDGNIKHRASGAPATRAEVMAAIDLFFQKKTRDLEAIEGAAAALTEFAETANVVLLTNLPHTSKEDRIANLRDHGLAFPVITNTGPKGPAIKRLAQAVRGPVVFIDDSPAFIKSAQEHAPGAHLVHFMHDQRFAKHVVPFDFLSLFSGSWAEARLHIAKLIAA